MTNKDIIITMPSDISGPLINAAGKIYINIFKNWSLLISKFISADIDLINLTNL